MGSSTRSRALVVTWACDVCGKPIADGYVTVSYAELAEYRQALQAWEERIAAAYPGPWRGYPATELLDLPDRVRWRVLHRRCDPEPDSPDYWVAVERIRTAGDVLCWSATCWGRVGFRTRTGRAFSATSLSSSEARCDPPPDRGAVAISVVQAAARKPHMPSMALFYGGAGIRVFPVNVRKEPLTPKGTSERPGGFHYATTDREQIEKWWTRWPDAGIATPDFDVVDVDCTSPCANRRGSRSSR
jgi:Bifunctional DNA primase/polymerase, N-terminal